MKTSLITIKKLVSEAQCYATIRDLRWQGEVCALIAKVVKLSSVDLITNNTPANAINANHVKSALMI